MGRNSGGSGTGGGGGISAAVRAKFAGVKALQQVKDAKVRDALLKDLAAFDKEFGVDASDIALGSMGANTGGYTQYIKNRNTGELKWLGVRLNNDMYSGSNDAIVARIKHQEKTGWTVKTNNPAGSVLTHELSHRLMKNDSMRKEITGVLRAYKKSGSTSISRYATTDSHEFLAEAITQHLHGTRNQYTTAVYNIAKKYNKK